VKPCVESHLKKRKKSQAPVAQAYNPSYTGAEIRKIVVQSQPGRIVRETLSRKTLHKYRAEGVAQGEGTEFKPQYCKKKKKNNY
jgi:hypothetical protein